MSNLVDPDAGRVLARVVCDHCGNRVVGVVQEYWTERTPRGELLSGWRFATCFGKVRSEQRGRGTAVGATRLDVNKALGREELLLLCPRHGSVWADGPELVACVQESEQQGQKRLRVVRAMRHP